MGEHKIRFNIYYNEIGDPDGQIRNLEQSLAGDRPDAIIIIPIKSDEISKTLAKYDYGNVVTIDKALSAGITHIGSDYAKFGAIAAQMTELARRPEEALLVIHTNDDKISSEDYYRGFLSELQNTKARNYDCIYIQDIRENMEKILEYKGIGTVKYIFASRFLTEIIDYMDTTKHKDIKYAACSINDKLKEHIKSGKVISGININYHLHGYLAAKAAFNIIDSQWESIHYTTNNQIIIKGNLNNLDDNNIVEMQTLFNIL